MDGHGAVMGEIHPNLHLRRLRISSVLNFSKAEPGACVDLNLPTLRVIGPRAIHSNWPANLPCTRCMPGSPLLSLQGLSVCVTVIIFLWLGWLYLSKPPAVKDTKVEQGAGASPAASALAPLGAGLPEARPLTHDEYITKHTPRIEFQPWSAPVFDDRTVQSQPELYCMASGTTDKDTTCTCLTEQGTKAKVRLPVCVAIARDGPAYNPYKQPGQVGPDRPPFPGDVAGQRPPGHVARLKAVAFRGEHVASLKAETGPRAGHFDAVVRVHRGHAAISSLLGSREGRQDLIQSQTHERRRIIDFA